MASLNLSSEDLRLYEIFLPQQQRRYKGLLENSNPLVHYTSAEAALSIITNRTLWLRNARFMNDSSEIQYGAELVSRFFNVNNRDRAKFWEVVDSKTGRRIEEFREKFNHLVDDIFSSTFIFCLSEHEERENDLGRLSMWRAYGKPHGVALVVDPSYMNKELNGLNATSYAIEYPTEIEAFKFFREMETNFLNAKNLCEEDVFEGLIVALQTFILTIKHPGFHEEREWRAVFRPNEQLSEFVTQRVHSINGIPQELYELQLDKELELDLPRILKRVTIGPSTHAPAIRRALVLALMDAGVERAESIVVCSGLPLQGM